MTFARITPTLTVRCQTCGNTWPSTDDWGGTVAYCTDCAKTGGTSKSARPSRTGVISNGVLTEDGNPFNLRYAVLAAQPGDVLEDVTTPDYVVGDALYRTGLVVDADHRGLGVAWPAGQDTAHHDHVMVRATSETAAVIHATVGPGDGSFTIDGVAHPQETRDRIRAAVVNGGYDWPTGRVTVTVEQPVGGPLDSSHDLAIACAILAAAGHYSQKALADVVFIGELGLDGRVRPVPDVNAAARSAIGSAWTTAIIADDDLANIDVAEIGVYGAATLHQAVRTLQTFARAANA